MSKYNIIIWDFNGTLFDDFGCCLTIINGLLSEYSLPLLTAEKYREIFRFPISDYYADTGITAFAPFEVLADRFTEVFLQKSMLLPCFPDVPQVLEQLDGKLRQLIISATQQELLRSQVEMLGIGKYFTDLLGISDYYAGGKSALAKKWLADNAATDQQIILVGDSEHDYEVAQEIGADCLLVCRGHVSRQRLQQTGVPVLDDVLSVLDYVS